MHTKLPLWKKAFRALAVAAGSLLPASASAQECPSPCFDGGGILAGLGFASGIIGLLQGDPTLVVGGIMTRILLFLAFICVICIIIAGFYLILGLGDESTRDRAKRIVLYTIIGLAIIILAKPIVDIVFYAFSGQGDAGDAREVVVDIIKRVLNFLALIAVVMVIIAGFYLVLSLGNDEQKDKAKKIILYTLIGLVIILFSRVIVELVIAVLT